MFTIQHGTKKGPFGPAAGGQAELPVRTING